MEKEIHILGFILLENPRGSLCNRRDARDEKPLREPAKLLRRVWEDERYIGCTAGPGKYARTRQPESREVPRYCQLRSYQRREEDLFSSPEQYQGPVSLLVEYKGNNKHGIEKVPKPEVS